MIDGQEEVADIVAEMRWCASQLPPRQKRLPTLYVSTWNALANRFDEADKRQRSRNCNRFRTTAEAIEAYKKERGVWMMDLEHYADFAEWIMAARDAGKGGAK